MAPDAPEAPVELAYIWEWFERLRKKRQTGMGVDPLSSQEILAWQTRFRLDITPFEHEVLDRLDHLYVFHQNKKAS